MPSILSQWINQRDLSLLSTALRPSTGKSTALVLAWTRFGRYNFFNSQLSASNASTDSSSSQRERRRGLQIRRAFWIVHLLSARMHNYLHTWRSICSTERWPTYCRPCAGGIAVSILGCFVWTTPGMILFSRCTNTARGGARRMRSRCGMQRYRSLRKCRMYEYWPTAV